MENKKLGIIIIIIAIALLLVGFFFRSKLVESYNFGMSNDMNNDGSSCGITSDTCPHQKINNLLIPTIIWVVLVAIIIVIGIYLIFFEKDQKMLQESQEKIVKTLEETKKQQDTEQNFELILSALDEDEKNIIKSVKEQDGITQATLRIRTGISKAKLSILLNRLEKKDLIKKVPKGKTNQVFLKRKI